MASTIFDKARDAARLLSEVTAELEGNTLDVEGAKVLVDVFTRCERFAVAGRGVAARRVATAVNWKRAGHRNAAEWFSSTTGVSLGESARELDTARRLEELPATAAAFRAGELSSAQAGEIAATATMDPSAEQRLLNTVRDGGSFRAVRDQCREASMRASDDDAKARRLHETRSARTYNGVDGHLVLHAEFAPDVGARVVSVLDQATKQVFDAARANGTTELHVAYAADALAKLILGEISVRPAAETRMHVDGPALERGYALPGERCHLDGVGPIPVAVAKSMLNDSVVTVFRHDETGEISHVSSPTRTIPIRLRRWVEESYAECGRSGCTSRFRLEIDHVTPYAKGGPTSKDNLWRLCGHDHHLKTYRGWQVVERADGTRDLVPPPGHVPRDDPPEALRTRGHPPPPDPDG